MTPIGHAAIAVLTAWSLTARGLLDVRRATGLCLLGATLPDLVDKPLVAVGVVEVAHTVGHSVLVLALVTLTLVAAAVDRARTWPFLAGWAGHVAADLVVAYPKFLRNYAWPVLSPRPTPDDPVVAYWLEYAAGPLFGLELGLAALAAVAWYHRDRAGDGPTDDRVPDSD